MMASENAERRPIMCSCPLNIYQAIVREKAYYRKYVEYRIGENARDSALARTSGSCCG